MEPIRKEILIQAIRCTTRLYRNCSFRFKVDTIPKAQVLSGTIINPLGRKFRFPGSIDSCTPLKGLHALPFTTTGSYIYAFILNPIDPGYLRYEITIPIEYAEENCSLIKWLIIGGRKKVKDYGCRIVLLGDPSVCLPD